MDIEAGIGAGVRSPEAEARVARAGASHLPVPVPDLGDLAAVARWRAEVHAAWGEDLGDPPPERVTIAGVPCLAAGPVDAPTLVYAHGGGFLLGSAASAVPITARLARTLRVLSVDYRLAPEHPFPAALDDVTAVAAARGGAAIGGDSAGGGLALAATRRLGDAGTRPRAIVLLCPHLRHDPTEPFSAAYLAGHDADDPEASPLLAPLRDLPRLLVQTSVGEPLFAHAVALMRRARAAGVEATLDVWDGLWHAWHYHPELPESQRALDEAAAFVMASAELGFRPPWG